MAKGEIAKTILENDDRMAGKKIIAVFVSHTCRIVYSFSLNKK